MGHKGELNAPQIRKSAPDRAFIGAFLDTSCPFFENPAEEQDPRGDCREYTEERRCIDAPLGTVGRQVNEEKGEGGREDRRGTRDKKMRQRSVEIMAFCAKKRAIAHAAGI